MQSQMGCVSSCFRTWVNELTATLGRSRRLLREGCPSAATAACLVLDLALVSCGGGSKTTPTAPPSTPAPAADFSLTATPATVTLVAGSPGQAISVNAVPAHGFSAAVAVTVGGLPAGVTATPATLSLTPGTAQTTTLTAATGAAAATPTVSFTGSSGSLTHTAMVALSVQVPTPPPTPTPPPPASAPDATTYHYDNARDGLNAQETILTLSNVNSTQFGKIAFDAVDGKVDAEPLFVANVTMGGKQRNVLYVATEHDSVYSFDADDGTQLWKTSILGASETTSDDHNCSQITPEIGITSTPVIDRHQGANGTLFTIGMSKDSKGNYHQRLHALDLTAGHRNFRQPHRGQRDLSWHGRRLCEWNGHLQPGSIRRTSGPAAGQRNYLYRVDFALRWQAVYRLGHGLQRDPPCSRRRCST